MKIQAQKKKYRMKKWLVYWNNSMNLLELFIH